MQNFEHAFLDFDFLRELTALETKHLYLVSTQDYSNNVVTTRMVMLRGISWTIGVGQGIPELSYRGMCGEPGKAPEAGSWKTILGPQVLFIIPLMLHTPFIEPHVITGRTKPSADDNAYVACILEQYGLPNPA